MATQADPNRNGGISSGHIRSDGLSVQLFERDTRTFPEILNAWADHEGCIDEAFLQKTGLATFINPEDFRDIELGEKIPSERLARVMALHLPGGILRQAESSPDSVPKLYGFQNRAEYWRESLKNKGKPSIDISDDGFHSFCLQVLDELQKPEHSANESKTAPGPQLPAGPNMHDNIIGYLSSKCESRKTPEEIEEILLGQYKASAQNTARGLYRLLRNSDFDYTEKEIDNFLNTLSPALIPPTAQALRFMRQSRGMTQQALADKIDVSVQAISLWESGHRNISHKKLVEFTRKLSLSPEEAERLITLIEPDFTQALDAGWLKEQLTQKNWDPVNFPALDPAWLSAQDARSQAGLMLGGYRKRKGLSQAELAHDLGTTSQSISLWETGNRIPHKWLAPLIQELSLSVAEADGFVALIRKVDSQEIGSLLETQRERESLTRKELAGRLGLASPDLVGVWESGRGTISNNMLEKLKKELSFPPAEAARFSSLVEKSHIPLLDTSWLTVQKESRHPGDYLEAYRKRNNLSLEKLGRRVGVTISTVNKWEADGNIPPAYVKALSKALRLTRKETDRFTLLVIPALDPTWLSSQPRDKQTGLLVEAYRKREGLSQEQLGNAVGVYPAAIGGWEAGAEIPYLQLAPLMQGLSLSEEEKAHFLSIAIPTPDPEWLSAQGEKQAGLLLKTYRTRKGLKQQDLESALGVTGQTIGKWESGDHIALQYALKLARLLDMPANEAQHFIELTQFTEIPALDSAWLLNQEKSKQTGLLLEAYRKRKGLKQGELAHELGLASPSPVSKWELGHKIIPPERFHAIPKALGLSPEETEYFTRLRFPDSEALQQPVSDADKPRSFAERAVPRSIVPGSKDLERMDRTRSK